MQKADFCTYRTEVLDNRLKSAGKIDRYEKKISLNSQKTDVV
ncbi:hypothetical protein NVIE_002860 [Nitrososphaera viennensis EN76]|uniref:Uncharacterized protein n=1 Tax=Nitrososphaera viennensis EN76 TaxID=926571 RepID=A0A060HMQ7_9ARCH|nr:hypothetical protein NVIE_002860 [Nitrososphaera viennensis EN76]